MVCAKRVTNSKRSEFVTRFVTRLVRPERAVGHEGHAMLAHLGQQVEVEVVGAEVVERVVAAAEDAVIAQIEQRIAAQKL